MKRLASLAAVTLLFLSAAPVHAASPTATLRVEQTGCASVLVVDYSDFGPNDFVLGYIDTAGTTVGFYADLSGSGTVTVSGPLSGSLTADLVITPYPLTEFLRESFRLVPPGYDPTLYGSAPHSWGPSDCAQATPTIAAVMPVETGQSLSALGLSVASLAILGSAHQT